jgi:hypothetical protein
VEAEPGRHLLGQPVVVRREAREVPAVELLVHPGRSRHGPATRTAHAVADNGHRECAQRRLAGWAAREPDGQAPGHPRIDAEDRMLQHETRVYRGSKLTCEDSAQLHALDRTGGTGERPAKQMAVRRRDWCGAA